MKSYFESLLVFLGACFVVWCITTVIGRDEDKLKALNYWNSGAETVTCLIYTIDFEKDSTVIKEFFHQQYPAFQNYVFIFNDTLDSRKGALIFSMFNKYRISESDLAYSEVSDIAQQQSFEITYTVVKETFN